MKSDAPLPDGDPHEAQLTALLLGELDANQAAQVRAALEADPALRQLHDRLERTLALVREAIRQPGPHPAAVALRLSDTRRQELLARFKVTPLPRVPNARRQERNWILPIALAAALVLLIAVANLVFQRESSPRLAIIEHLGFGTELASAPSAATSWDAAAPASVEAKADAKSNGRVDYFSDLGEVVASEREARPTPQPTPLPKDEAPKPAAIAQAEERGMADQMIRRYGLVPNPRKAQAPPGAVSAPAPRPQVEAQVQERKAEPSQETETVGHALSIAPPPEGEMDTLAAVNPIVVPSTGEVAFGVPITGGVTAVVPPAPLAEPTSSANFSEAVDNGVANVPVPGIAPVAGLEAAPAPPPSPAPQRDGRALTRGWSEGAVRAASPSARARSSISTEAAPTDSLELARSFGNTAAPTMTNGTASDFALDGEHRWYAKQGQGAGFGGGGGAGGFVDAQDPSWTGAIAMADSEATALGVFRDLKEDRAAQPRNELSRATKYRALVDRSAVDNANRGGAKAPVLGDAPTLGQQFHYGPAAGAKTREKLNETLVTNQTLAPAEDANSTQENLGRRLKRGDSVTESRSRGVVALEAAVKLAPAKDKRATDGDEVLAKAPVALLEALPEVLTADQAFSTFSLNVTDVSFRLAAASLEQGALPDPSTVRSEEFLNAFDYRDPEPAPGAPVGFTWERAQYPFAQNREVIRFALKTAASGRSASQPLNVVLLLDSSGSMERADRVRILHEALRVLATQLKPQDRVSVVTFARTAQLVFDGLAGDAAAQLPDRLGGLTPEGGTNLEEALKLAYETALRHRLANGINRVVLLTDGAANLGQIDPEVLKREVEKQRGRGIALDCFGIGWEGYNDDLLEMLARNGDGRYGFINTPEEAATGFSAQLAGALQVAAADVKVQVEFNPTRVSAYRQVGYRKHQLTREQFRDNTVDAAEIGAAESGNALYVAQVEPQGEGPVAWVRVRFKVPATGEYQEHEWTVPYKGKPAGLDHAGPALCLATTAAAFAEWLGGNPHASEVTPDRLLTLLQGVPATFLPDPRPGQLESMIRQASSLDRP